MGLSVQSSDTIIVSQESGVFSLELRNGRHTYLYTGTGYTPRNSEFATFVGGDADPALTSANAVTDGDMWINNIGELRTRIQGAWAPAL
jgi:ferredoxin-NADP reductase